MCGITPASDTRGFAQKPVQRLDVSIDGTRFGKAIRRLPQHRDQPVAPLVEPVITQIRTGHLLSPEPFYDKRAGPRAGPFMLLGERARYDWRWSSVR